MTAAVARIGVWHECLDVDTLRRLVELLGARRADERALGVQLEELIALGALRRLARRRVAVVHPSGHQAEPVAFDSAAARAAALASLAVDVAHRADQRALLRALGSGGVGLAAGAEVQQIEVAVRLNTRAMLRLGRPVVGLTLDGRLVVDDGPWPDPAWTARVGFEAALRDAAQTGRGAAVWVSPCGRSGLALPPAGARWVQLVGSGPRPRVRLVDERMRGGPMPWAAGLDALVRAVSNTTPMPDRVLAAIVAAARATAAPLAWWVQAPEGAVLDLPPWDDRDPDGWEVGDPLVDLQTPATPATVADRSSLAPPVGAVLWAIDDETETRAWAVLTAGGWAPLPRDGAWLDLVARDEAISRWWPGVPADVAGAHLVVVPGDVGLDALAVIADAVERPAGLDRLALVSGPAVIVDDCPDPRRRAARWEARARTQAVGELLTDGLPTVDWGRLDERRVYADEPAEELLAAAPEHRAQLGKRLRRGPDSSPPLPGPWRFIDGAATLRGSGGLASTRDRRVRRRKGPGGRPKRLSVEQYLGVRMRLAREGQATTDVDICRELAVGGVEVSRTVVRQRRLEAEAAGLLELGAEVITAGLETPAAVPASASAPPEAAPFISIAGSKARLLPHLLEATPEGRLPLVVEPCLGGGSWLLALAAAGRFDRAIASDQDPDIIAMWRGVQQDPDQVFEIASGIPWTREAFYATRVRLSTMTGIERAGAALYINRRAYNGVFPRRGQGQHLNVSCGDKKRLVVSQADLRRISRLVRNVEFRCADAERVIRGLGPDRRGVVVYADVPYWPVAKSSSFVYGAFYAGDHVRMVAALREHGQLGGLGLLSNHSNAPVQRLIEAADGRMRWVTAWRSVSSDPETRGGTPEVIAAFGNMGGI